MLSTSNQLRWWWFSWIVCYAPKKQKIYLCLGIESYLNVYSFRIILYAQTQCVSNEYTHTHTPFFYLSNVKFIQYHVNAAYFYNSGQVASVQCVLNILSARMMNILLQLLLFLIFSPFYCLLHVFLHCTRNVNFVRQINKWKGKTLFIHFSIT